MAPNARKPVWVYSRNAKIIAGRFAVLLSRTAA